MKKLFRVKFSSDIPTPCVNKQHWVYCCACMVQRKQYRTLCIREFITIQCAAHPMYTYHVWQGSANQNAKFIIATLQTNKSPFHRSLSNFYDSFITHYSDVAWASWHLKSRRIRQCVQQPSQLEASKKRKQQGAALLILCEEKQPGFIRNVCTILSSKIWCLQLPSIA